MNDERQLAESADAWVAAEAKDTHLSTGLNRIMRMSGVTPVDTGFLTLVDRADLVRVIAIAFSLGANNEVPR